MKENKEIGGTPLILVFYLFRELMENKEILIPFTEYVNNIIVEKNANIIAFFLPTDGDEKIECLNPVMVKEADMVKINTLLEDIKKNFSVGVENNIPNENIILDEKPCMCGTNPDGNCKCENQ